jgi:hypothetical protein
MPTARPRRRARSATLLLACLVLATLVVMPSLAVPGSSFESADGNLIINTPGNIDWNTFIDPAKATAYNFDKQIDAPTAGAPTPDDKYAGGVKHDTICPGLTTGTEQNKSDFTGMYIAHEKLSGLEGDDADFNGNTILYLAWHRVKQNNDTNSGHASFIFAQSSESCGNDLPDRPEGEPSFTPLRTHGDMLVTYDFTGGATGIPTIGLSRWIEAGKQVPPNWLSPTGGLTPTSTATTSMCETGKSLPCWGKVIDGTATGFADGAVNHRGIGPVEDEHIDAFRGVVEFGEAALNLTKLGVFPEGEQCGVTFGSVHVGSRASGNSFDSQLKDLIRPLSIDLDDCGGIKVKKVTVPAGDTTTEFDFRVDDDPVVSFSLKDGQTESDALADLVAGTYKIAEDDPSSDGYDLTSISCLKDTNGTPDPVGMLVNSEDLLAGVNVPVNPGDDITCTFTNTKRGAIKIVKETEPSGATEAFDFSAPAGLTPLTFSLKDGDPAEEFLNVKPGQYVFTETNENSPKFALTDVSCDDANSVGSVENKTATVNLDPGETVTCTFTNSLQLGSLLVKKTYSVDPGTGNFASFTISPANADGDTALLRTPTTDPKVDFYCIDGLLYDDETEYTISEGTPPTGFTGSGPFIRKVQTTDTCAERIADYTAGDEDVLATNNAAGRELTVNKWKLTFDPDDPEADDAGFVETDVALDGFRFTLYPGGLTDGVPNGLATPIEQSTATVSGTVTFDAALAVGSTYSVCETGVPTGEAGYWSDPDCQSFTVALGTDVELDFYNAPKADVSIGFTDVTGYTSITIRCYDADGIELFEDPFTSGVTGSLDLDELPLGDYSCDIELRNGGPQAPAGGVAFL